MPGLYLLRLGSYKGDISGVRQPGSIQAYQAYTSLLKGPCQEIFYFHLVPQNQISFVSFLSAEIADIRDVHSRRRCIRLSL